MTDKPDIILGLIALAIIAVFSASVYGYRVALRWDLPEPAPPTFTCYQTIDADDARKLSADLWNRASKGERTRLVVGCKSGVTRLTLERVR